MHQHLPFGVAPQGAIAPNPVGARHQEQPVVPAMWTRQSVSVVSSQSGQTGDAEPRPGASAAAGGKGIDLPDFAQAYLKGGGAADDAEQSPANSAAPIYLLCQSDRQPIIEQLLAGETSSADPRRESVEAQWNLNFIADLETLTRACDRQPPLALFVDSVTSARLGPRQMAPMFVSQHDWPVLRLVPRKGVAIVFSLHPPLRTTFRDALRKLRDQGADWLMAQSQDDESEADD